MLRSGQKQSVLTILSRKCSFEGRCSGETRREEYHLSTWYSACTAGLAVPTLSYFTLLRVPRYPVPSSPLYRAIVPPSCTIHHHCTVLPCHAVQLATPRRTPVHPFTPHRTSMHPSPRTVLQWPQGWLHGAITAGSCRARGGPVHRSVGEQIAGGRVHHVILLM